MRVVHLYKDYHPPTFGGIEQTIERLATSMARGGAEVTVVTSHPGSRRTVVECVAGVRVIRCGEWVRAWSAPFCPGMPGELKKLDADVYHVHYPSPPGELSWLLTRPRGALVVSWYCEIVRQRAVLPIYGRFIHALLYRADSVMTIYEGQAKDSTFLRRYPEKVRVVPLGIDLEAFETDGARAARVAELRARFDGDPLIVFVGRLVPYKGLDVLLAAMRSVEARCVIVGGGPELGRLRAISASFGLDSRVTFTGRLEQDRLVDYVAAADVGVLPSISVQEAYGLAMAEMMAMGVPVVCTEVGTGTSFVNRHGETGLVVPPRDPGALAAALRHLLGDERERIRMGGNARARARRLFSTDAMTHAVGAVYGEVMARRRGA